MAYRANRRDGDGKSSMGSGAEEKRLATCEFTRRRFLGMSAGLGVGLFVLGAGGCIWNGREEDSPNDSSPPDLEIFRKGYPRAFFFRQTETEARSGNLSYEMWEERYLPLNGIVGQVLDESSEHSGKYDNLPFFLQYKENNPSKA